MRAGMFRLRKMTKPLTFCFGFVLFEGSYLLKHLEWKWMVYAVVRLILC